MNTFKMALRLSFELEGQFSPFRKIQFQGSDSVNTFKVALRLSFELESQFSPF